jgi:hypothetical protein
MRWVVIGAAVLVMCVGCASKSDNNKEATAAVVRAFPSATLHGATTHESLDGGRLQFDRPASWSLHRFTRYADITNHELGTNSNVDVRNPCRRNADTSEITCGAPVDRMPPSSVYIQWSVIEPESAEAPRPNSRFTVSGANTQVDGHPASLTARDSCGNLDGDREVSLLLTPGAQRTYWALACVRGPGAQELEANLLATFRTIRVTA